MGWFQVQYLLPGGFVLKCKYGHLQVIKRSSKGGSCDVIKFIFSNEMIIEILCRPASRCVTARSGDALVWPSVRESVGIVI